MAWVKLDDQFHTDDKAVIAGLEGRALYIAGLCWCARNLTDGNIDKRALPAIAALAGVTPDIADTLVAVGLWENEDASYRVPSFLNYQPSRQQVIADREAAAERQRRSREKSRRDSHSDSNGSNGVSSGAPSRPVPSPSELSLSQSSSDLQEPVDNPTTDETSTSSVPDGGGQPLSPAHLPSAVSHGSIETSQAGKSSPSGSSAPQAIAGSGERPEHPSDPVHSVPDETWDRYAQLKLEQQRPGQVRNRSKWKQTTAANAPEEVGDLAVRWWNTFDCTPQQLAAWLIDGQPSPYAKRRQEAS